MANQGIERYVQANRKLLDGFSATSTLINSSNDDKVITILNDKLGRSDRLAEMRLSAQDRVDRINAEFTQATALVLNDETLDFLISHSNIDTPTLTSIFTGYELARASEADRLNIARQNSVDSINSRLTAEQSRIDAVNQNADDQIDLIEAGRRRDNDQNELALQQQSSATSSDISADITRERDATRRGETLTDASRRRSETLADQARDDARRVEDQQRQDAKDELDRQNKIDVQAAKNQASKKPIAAPVSSSFNAGTGGSAPAATIQPTTTSRPALNLTLPTDDEIVQIESTLASRENTSQSGPLRSDVVVDPVDSPIDLERVEPATTVINASSTDESLTSDEDTVINQDSPDQEIQVNRSAIRSDLIARGQITDETPEDEIQRLIDLVVLANRAEAS